MIKPGEISKIANQNGLRDTQIEKIIYWDGFYMQYPKMIH